MKKPTNLLSLLFLCTSVLHAQMFNKLLNKDSVFQSLIKNVPEGKRQSFEEEYRAASDQMKEYVLFMLSMPRSSKKELIRNIDSNYGKVFYLKTEYAKLVPHNYQIQIEFEPENNLFNVKENINLKMTFYDHKGSKVYQGWDIRSDSGKLKEILASVGWNVINIAGHPFYVNVKFHYLATKDDFSTRIDLRPLKNTAVEADAYEFFYSPRTKQVIDVYHHSTNLPKDLIAVRIPAEHVLDPVGFARDNGITNLEDWLMTFPIQRELKATILPLSQTVLVKIAPVRNAHKMDGQKNQPGRKNRIK